MACPWAGRARPHQQQGVSVSAAAEEYAAGLYLGLRTGVASQRGPHRRFDQDALKHCRRDTLAAAERSPCAAKGPPRGAGLRQASAALPKASG